MHLWGLRGTRIFALSVVKGKEKAGCWAFSEQKKAGINDAGPVVPAR
jgi:hypothetical protein